jgi:hypothetical protein
VFSPVVVLFSTYPIQKPQHGGQVRAKALADAYKQAGFEVHSLAVYVAEAYSADRVGPLDIAFDAQDPRWHGSPHTTDFMSGLFAAKDEPTYRKIRGSLPARIDLLHLEQPWLLPLVERLRTEPRCANSKLVYGSQNIEEPLKRAALSQGRGQDEDLLGKIHDLEVNAVRGATLVFAASRADQAALERMGAKQVVYAPNGTSPWQASEERLEYWRARLPKEPWALFIGSAHPPNIQGFFDWCGDSLAFLSPISRLVLAGTASGEILRSVRLGKWSSLNESRIMVLGALDEPDLAAVKALASVYLLPISQGGGSNLKTAEAIFSCRPVVGTRVSFRDYERFMQSPEIEIADTAAEFRKAVAKRLASPRPKLGTVDEARRTLLWSNCLANAMAAARDLSQGVRRAIA